MIRVLLPALLLILSCNACIVSKQKYDDLLAEKVITEAALAREQQQLDSTTAVLNTRHKQLDLLKADSASLAERNTQLSLQLNQCQQELAELQGYYDNVINNKAKLDQDLAAQRRSLLRARDSLLAERIRNEALLADLSEREQRVGELERVLQEKEDAVSLLRKSISDALFNFAESDLTVEIKNGKVYVSLAEKLLFRSGSRTVDPQGVEALRQLAGVLQTQEDISVLVEGHTDNVPIGGSNPYRKDNWDLSVLRATSIVNILVAEGVAPERVTAAGKGEHAPVTDNETAEGRSLNRRTEIIITPALNELLEILETR